MGTQVPADDNSNYYSKSDSNSKNAVEGHSQTFCHQQVNIDVGGQSIGMDPTSEATKEKNCAKGERGARVPCYYVMSNVIPALAGFVAVMVRGNPNDIIEEYPTQIWSFIVSYIIYWVIIGKMKEMGATIDEEEDGVNDGNDEIQRYLVMKQGAIVCTIVSLASLISILLRYQLTFASIMLCVVVSLGVALLPITSSRNAKWWYSAFHNVTAMVGVGVLSLPYAMSHLGWGPGVAVMIISWIITLYTLWQMVEMHEMVPGKRFDRYHELGQHAFGEKLGLYIVVPQQLIVEVGVNIVYMVTGGKSLQKFHNLVCPECKDIKLTYFIMIFGSAHFVLSHLPNFNSISGVSLAAAVTSLSYSTIAWGASVEKGVQSDVDYGYKAHSTSGTVFNFFNALGDVTFAYAGHNVVLEIQATIPSTPEKPSKGPMWRGVIVSYIVVALCYFPVAFVGYWAFGNSVQDNILISLEKPVWLIALANLFVVIHAIGSYQIYAMPVFDKIETVLVKKLRFKPTWYLRFISRNVYVGLTMFIGMTFPFFGGLLGFFGGFAFAPTTYFLPCIMWLAIYKPRKFSLSWITNWICIILGVLLMIIAPIGGLRQIILSAKDYHFYS